MDQSPYIYLGMFALIAFLLKAVILFHTRIKSFISKCFAVLCLLFLAQNAAEFLGYFTYLTGQEDIGLFMVHIYMVTLYFVFPAVMQLALALGGSPTARMISVVNFSLAGLITLAHAGGYVISGFEFLGWSTITTPGEYYGVAMGYILLNTVGTVGYLIVKTTFSENFEIRDRTRVNLVAMIPLFLVAFGVVLLRLKGFNSSSAISLPIATTIFLFVLLLQTNGNLFWLSLRLKSIIEILKIKDLSSIDQIIDRLDEVRIRQALRATNGSQRSTAQLINLSEPTLSRRISRYKIDVGQYQRKAARV